MRSQLELVRTVASSLAGAHTEAEVADAVLTAVADHLGAATASLWLLSVDDSEMVLAYERNAASDAVARFGRIPADADLPGPLVARSRAPAFVSSRAERDLMWPTVAGTPTVSEALVVLPLVAPHKVLGVVAFGFPEVRKFDADDRLTLMAVADQCAVALDRARLFQALRADSEANDLLARVSAAGGGSDWQQAAQRIVQICSDALVDSCAVYFREGNMVRRVAAASRTYSEVLGDLVGRFPTPISSDSPNAIAIRTGEPVRVPQVDAQVAHAASPSPEYQRLVRHVALGDVLVVPLQEGGRTFGAMLFAALPDEGPIPPEVVDLAMHVAGRTAAVLRTAEQLNEHREVLDAMHAVLLPGDIPDIEGVELAACYQPVATGPAVGGDWWDVVSLPNGRIALSVGDVAGHGVGSVGLMGQLRAAARTHLVSGSGPAETLASLSALLDWTEPSAHATAIVAILDLASNVLTAAAAGHPPALILGANGEAQFVDCPPAPPLGLRTARAEYTDTVLDVPADATIALYTDGLVEDRHRPIDAGIARLVETLRGVTGQALQQQCERAVAEMVEAPEDDVCLVLARRAARA